MCKNTLRACQDRINCEKDTSVRFRCNQSFIHSVCVVDTSCSTAKTHCRSMHRNTHGKWNCEPRKSSSGTMERNYALLLLWLLHVASHRQWVFCVLVWVTNLRFINTYLRNGVSCERAVHVSKHVLCLPLSRMRTKCDYEYFNSNNNETLEKREKWIGWRQPPWRRKWLCVLFCAQCHPHIDNIHVIVSSKYFANVFPENYLPTSQRSIMCKCISIFSGRSVAVNEKIERSYINLFLQMCRLEALNPAWMCECAIHGWTTNSFSYVQVTLALGWKPTTTMTSTILVAAKHCPLYCQSICVQPLVFFGAVCGQRWSPVACMLWVNMSMSKHKTHMYHKWNVSVSLIILYIINFYFSCFVQRTPSSLPPTLSFGTFTLLNTCASGIGFLFLFSSIFYFWRNVFFFLLDSIVLANWALALHPLCVIPMPNGVVLSDQACEALKWHSI